MRLRRSKIRIMHAGGNIERATCECVRGYVERGKEGARTTGWPRQLPKKRKLRKEKEKKRDGITRKLYIFFHYIYIAFYFIELPIASSLRKMIFLIEFSRKIPSRRVRRTRSSFCFFFFFHFARSSWSSESRLRSLELFFIGGRVSSRGKTMYVCARSTINERVRARSLVFLTYIITRIISP